MMFVYRHYIYAALFIIPVLCSTLNYSVRTGRYTASGAFCMLPVRPLWSRLALSWIPRYIIGMTILGLTIAVYVHVRNVYKGTGRTRWWALSSIAVPKDTSDPSQPSVEASAHMQSSYARESHATGDTFDAFSLTNSDAAPSRRLSTLTTAAASTPARTPKWDETTFTNLNLPAPPARFGGQRRSVVSISSSSSSTGLPPRRIRSFDLPPHTRDESLASADPANTLSIPPPTKPRRASAQRPSLTRISSTFSGLSNRSRGSKTSITLPGALTLPNPARLLKRSRILSSASNHLRSQRAAIRRHLRLTFIYPLVYIAMWLCPFILHCMQYNDYFAANLPFALGVVATLCYTLMAAVDCAIFGYREKPWRHMTGGGDGTFLGSFCPWRRGGGGGGGGGRMMSGQVDGSSRWESWDEKGGSRSRRNKRTRRGESIDSDLDIAPDAHAPAVGLVIDEERTIDSGGFGRAEPSSTSTGRRLNTLATIDSSEITNENASQRHTSQQTQEPFLSNVTEIPARLRRTASAAPKQLSRQPGRIARRLHLARSLSKRSDAEKLASEHAKARLKQELQDRRAMEEEKMTTSEGWACAVGSVTCNTPNKGPKERHWWDVVRKDSEAVAWGGSRRGTRAVMLDVVSSPSESEPASPGLSPGQSPDEHGGHVGVSSKEKAQEDIATKQRSNEKQEDKEPGRSLV